MPFDPSTASLAPTFDPSTASLAPTFDPSTASLAPTFDPKTAKPAAAQQPSTDVTGTPELRKLHEAYLQSGFAKWRASGPLDTSPFALPHKMGEAEFGKTYGALK